MVLLILMMMKSLFDVEVKAFERGFYECEENFPSIFSERFIVRRVGRQERTFNCGGVTSVVIHRYYLELLYRTN